MEKVFSLPLKTKEKDSLEITLVNKAKKVTQNHLQNYIRFIKFIFTK